MFSKKPKKESSIPNYEILFNENADKATKKPLVILIQILKSNFFNVIVCTLLYLVKSCAIWLTPIFTANIINAVTYTPEKARSIILTNIVLLLIVLLQNIPTHVLYAKFSNNMLRNIGAGMRNTMIKKLQHLSLTYHKQMESGKIHTKFIRDIEAIEGFNNLFLNQLIPAILSVLISMSVAVSKSGAISLFYLVVIPVNVVMVRVFLSKIRKNNRSYREENENVSANMATMIEMIQITKAHGLENKEISRLENSIMALRKKGLKLDNTNAYFGSVTWVVSQVLSGACLLFSALLALDGKIDIGDIVIYQTYFSSISSNVQLLIGIFPEMTKGLESVRSVSEIVLSKDTDHDENKIKLRYVHGSVNFENVSYKYPDGDEKIINNVSLDVEPGECVAFVGSSGSGKTTIMNMIIGFLKPTEGVLKLDGKPTDAIDLSTYRQFLSVVPQNSILFPGTIRENITYGLSNVSEEAVQNAVRLANLDEFIDTLPNGLDTMVGERGDTLSGGQKQRISIARALIRDPKILILDEATSALDNVSEYYVQQAIKSVKQGRTTFIVAHRLSTIRDADKIVVMKNGEIVETGSYDELVAKKGHFYELKKLNDIKSDI